MLSCLQDAQLTTLKMLALEDELEPRLEHTLAYMQIIELSSWALGYVSKTGWFTFGNLEYYEKTNQHIDYHGNGYRSDYLYVV